MIVLATLVVGANGVKNRERKVKSLYRRIKNLKR